MPPATKQSHHGSDSKDPQAPKTLMEGNLPLQLEELWSQEGGAYPCSLLFSLSSHYVAAGTVVGDTRQSRATRAPAFLLEDQKAEPQGTRIYQGGPGEGETLESNPIKIFMNSQVHP